MYRPLPPPRVGNPVYTELQGALRDAYDTARWSVEERVWQRRDLRTSSEVWHALGTTRGPA